MSDVNSRLRKTILTALKREQAIDSFPGENLIQELGITSIDALELLIWIENEFKIQIHDEDLTQEMVTSLPALEAYVRKQMG